MANTTGNTLNINNLSPNDYQVTSTPAPLNINNLNPASYQVASGTPATSTPLAPSTQSGGITGFLKNAASTVAKGITNPLGTVGAAAFATGNYLKNKLLPNTPNPIQEYVSSVSNDIGKLPSQVSSDVQAGSQDMQNGNVLKGTLKTGGRVAGDVAGAAVSPISSAINTVLNDTGAQKGIDYLGKQIADKTGVSDIPSVQQWATAHPNAAQDFARALNLIPVAGEETKIDGTKALSDVKTGISNGAGELVKTAKDLTPDVFTKSVDQLRSEKIASGFEEQNNRLKSVGNSFNENTKTYTNSDGTKIKVTPVDTFAKYNITPEVDRGSIQMGDYKTGTGALGKIREQVTNLDNQVDEKLKDSGKGVPIDQFKNQTIEQVKNDPTLRQQGKVASTISKLNGVFDDYKSSYGDTLPETEINSIRKVMNQDYNQDTMDVSRLIGDAARKIVYDTTPDNAVKDMLLEQGKLLAAKKYAEKINGTKVAGGRLGTMALRTTGAIIGSTIPKVPLVGSLLMAIGGEYTSRALQQTQFKSVGAETKALLKGSVKK